jgi:hypothetical protein
MLPYKSIWASKLGTLAVRAVHVAAAQQCAASSAALPITMVRVLE